MKLYDIKRLNKRLERIELLSETSELIDFGLKLGHHLSLEQLEFISGCRGMGKTFIRALKIVKYISELPISEEMKVIPVYVLDVQHKNDMAGIIVDVIQGRIEIDFPDEEKDDIHFLENNYLLKIVVVDNEELKGRVNKLFDENIKGLDVLENTPYFSDLDLFY
jgi:hypothetical protein